MPRKRLHVRKVAEVLRMKFEGFSNRKIATSCNVGRSTVTEYLLRFEKSGLKWPLPDDLTESKLEGLLFPERTEIAQDPNCPNWDEIHSEYSKKGVTLALLWQEFMQRNPNGRRYNWFCKKYREWAKCTRLVMRQNHKAGEKLFVDYAGQTVIVTDPKTGVKYQAQIFVAVLGASNYTYAEATPNQDLRNWLGSQTRAVEYFGGVPRVIVPDNLKTGVTKACYYDPEINPAYQDWARHYGAVVIPTRVRAPKDKAKVEAGVLLVERWILAKLRNLYFFSLVELNREIRKLVDLLNDKPFQKLEGSRRSVFESIEKHELLPLPAEKYLFVNWIKAKVGIDYHIEVDGHYYSVPFNFHGKHLDVRITENTVEGLLNGDRVVSHARDFEKGKHTTLSEHMPPNHQFLSQWSPERFIRWAGKIGPNTEQFAVLILNERVHQEQAFRSLLGIMRLAKSYPVQRVEAACQRAIRIKALSYRSVQSILKTGLDSRPLPEAVPEPDCNAIHENIRGPEYFSNRGLETKNPGFISEKEVTV